MPSLAILDSGPIIASLNRADPDHSASVEILRSREFEFVIPALCVAEVCYLIGSRVGSTTEALFLRGLERFDVRAPTHDEWPRVAQLVETYADLPLGGTDASVLTAAERLNADVIVTLDERHFHIARPNNRARVLIPKAST